MAKSCHMNENDDDSIIEIRIGMSLRMGVLISAAVILLGGALFLLHHARSIPDYRVFQGVPPDLRTLRGIISGAMHGNDLAIIQLGLVLLIATPITRVVFSILVFLVERDYLYVTISTVVLLILAHSLIWH
jgi:uncharacterized membrane protein